MVNAQDTVQYPTSLCDNELSIHCTESMFTVPDFSISFHTFMLNNNHLSLETVSTTKVFIQLPQQWRVSPDRISQPCRTLLGVSSELHTCSHLWTSIHGQPNAGHSTVCALPVGRCTPVWPWFSCERLEDWQTLRLQPAPL